MVNYTKHLIIKTIFKRVKSQIIFLDISEPRRSAFLLNGNSKAPLPNVRLLSNLLFREPSKPLKEVVALTTNWAFFIYTDLVHIGSSQLAVGTLFSFLF